MSRVRVSIIESSNEAISVQNGALFAELKKAVNFLRENGKFDTDAINKSEIVEIVRAYTNMSIIFTIGLGREAHIRLPNVDANHPFNRGWYDMFGAYEGAMVLRALNDKALGGVSLKEGRVYGVYEKIFGEVCMGQKFLRDSRYTDGMVAAIILHELGHLYTYFEMLGSVVTTSHAISCASKTVMGTEDYEKRISVIKEAERALGIDIKEKDREALAAKPPMIRDLAVETTFIAIVAKKSRSETGKSVYDLRSCEQIADQFAARHGAGRDLVLALDRLFKDHGDDSVMNSFEFVIMTVLRMIAFLAGLILFTIPTILWVLFFNPTIKYYDEPKARITFLRQQMELELRDKSISDSRRDEILRDLELVESVEDGLDDKRGLIELFWTEIIPSGISAAQEEKAQKKLEELLNNRLFVQSAKLKNLGV